MSQVILSQASQDAIADASGSQIVTTNKWKRAGTLAAKDGVTSDMLIKSTEKHPNETFNPEIYETIFQSIVLGVSARVKTLTLPSGKYTVAEMIALKDQNLKDIDDPVMKTMRREYLQQAQGRYMNLIRFYIDRHLGVERKKEPKTKQENEGKNGELTIPNDDKIWIQFLESIRANVPGRKSWPADDIVAVQDSATRMIALITRNK
jgi:hypothetical protein